MPDPKAPDSLIQLQEWFSQAVICQSEEDQLRVFSESGHYIKSSSNLEAKERLSIYMTDFWPRCLNSLEEDFPLLCQHMSKPVFLTWMKQYLDAYPSRSFTLFHLPNDLEGFLETQYYERDRDIVLDIAQYEWAYCSAAIAKESVTFNPNLLTDQQKQSVLDIRFKLNDSLRILKRQYSFSDDSKELKADAHAICIYRQDYKVKETRIPYHLFDILEAIQKGVSVRDALEMVRPSLSHLDEFIQETQINTWFGICVQNGWFLHPQS